MAEWARAVAEAGVPKGLERVGAEERTAPGVCGRPVSLLAEAAVSVEAVGVELAVGDLEEAVEVGGQGPAVRV